MTEISHNERLTLVVGGTGKTGRRVVARLGARGLPVRVGSRTGQPRFDWGDQSTWAPVLEGARAAYIPYPDLVIPVSVEDCAAGAAEYGVPAEFVNFLIYLFSDVLGNNAYVTDGVQRVLGRPPRDSTDYATSTAATGVWAQPADR